MMEFDILTLFPEIFPSILETSILGRAVKNNLLSFNYVNIRDFSNDKHSKVDDYPYGGGCGMLLQPQPVFDAYQSVLSPKEEKPLTIFMSPRGRTFNQEIAKEIVKHNHIVLICGHYEGIDQRVIDEIGDYELSIGDFVLTGGELAAMVVCDAVSRLVPGVLADEAGFMGESHYNGLLEYPQYTRPPVWRSREVPKVLFSGHQENIDEWRLEQSLTITENIRPDLFDFESHAPLAARQIVDDNSTFGLIGFGKKENQEFIFKNKRKVLQKLRKKGFAVQDFFSVIHDANQLKALLKKLCIPVIIFADSPLKDIPFEHPTMIIERNRDFSNLFPCCVDFDDQNNDLIADISRFLSISRIVSKYSK